MNKVLISMLRGLGILPQIQPTRYTGELVQSNPPQPLKSEDFVQEPEGLNWFTRQMWRNSLPPVPQAALGPRG